MGQIYTWWWRWVMGVLGLQNDIHLYAKDPYTCWALRLFRQCKRCNTKIKKKDNNNHTHNPRNKYRAKKKLSKLKVRRKGRKIPAVAGTQVWGQTNFLRVCSAISMCVCVGVRWCLRPCQQNVGASMKLRSKTENKTHSTSVWEGYRTIS